MKVLGNQSRGLLFVISAPSGTGKSSLVAHLEHEFACVKRIVTCTTRTPRGEEVDGVDYHFLSNDQFENYKKQGKFLENERVYDQQYGILESEVERVLKSGVHAALVIDTKGAQTIRKKMDSVLIFIAPPSEEEQRKRLEKRQTEYQDMVESRMSSAQNELEDARYFDYYIVNDNYDIAYDVLKSIFIAEEHKNINQEK